MPQYDWTKMTARKRDALVSTKVMELPEPEYNKRTDRMLHHFIEETWPGSGKFKENTDKMRTLKPYTTDISAAWEVVEKLREEWEVEIYVYKNHYAVQLSKPNSGPRHEVMDESLPDCISQIALRAKGVDV
jgi:hypothetical protein